MNRSAVAPIRWGFVGTGSIAALMADVLEAAPSAELVAVASRREKDMVGVFGALDRIVQRL